MRHDQGGCSTELNSKIPIGYSIQRIQADTVKTKLTCHKLTVNGETGPGQGGSPQRQYIYPFATVQQTLAIPLEHLGISQQMVAKGYGLGNLQVGKARHDSICVL